ncbi:MAG TPA: metallophosphoesterase [Ruania sp.]|nr:metallophosphoesterase [Ruania sp.]
MSENRCVVDDEHGKAGAPERRRRWPWWHRQTTLTRRVIRSTIAITVTGVLATLFGVLTASADSSLGPHAAHFAVSTDHEIAIDLGPLGGVLIDSPLPWPLGVDVEVQEIPIELSGAVPASPVTGLAGDLSAYAQVFSHPEAAVADASAALVRDALGRTVLMWSGLLVAISLGRLASRGLLRHEVAQALRRPGVLPLTAVVVLSLVVVPTAKVAQDRPAEGRVIGALAGTPLADLRMTGRMAQVIDTYGGYLVEAFEENEEFYARVDANLVAAYAENRAPRRPPGIPIVSPAPVDPEEQPTGSPADDVGVPRDEESGATPDLPGLLDGSLPEDPEATWAPDGEAATPDDVPTGAAQDAEELGAALDAEEETGDSGEPAATPQRVEPVTMLLVSDLHCNVGMASVIATALRLSGAEVLLDGGDTVMSGTSVESYCVNAFAGEIPDDVPMVVAGGNHDSLVTYDQMRDAGYTVLDGSVVEVAGVHILGDTDPTLTAVGEGTRPERDESVTEMGERLAEEACAAERVDLLFVHNPRAAPPTLDEGCAPLAISGHFHRRVGPEVLGAGVQYVSSSTAGASGGATIGPLNGPAEMTVLRIDANSGRPLDYRIITVATDTTVDIGRWYSFPDPAAEDEPTPIPTPTPTGDTGTDSSGPGGPPETQGAEN